MDEQSSKEITSSNSGAEEVGEWIYSMIPVGVAFTFYVAFILFSHLENKLLFIAYGVAAGFIGLESYWISRGLRKKHPSTVVMGMVGIVVTLALLFLVLNIK